MTFEVLPLALERLGPGWDHESALLEHVRTCAEATRLPAGSVVRVKLSPDWDQDATDDSDLGVVLDVFVVGVEPSLRRKFWLELAMVIGDDPRVDVLSVAVHSA